ncbi:hypothetical protein OIU84_020049 [Salix udensis]|uniref:Uncharacterized protein n=1 Tax=Salix udensis TaxID=889485 RepID=A0AAD6L1M6_9ROSI|nr:hypothetical protein OIU84_020049 [Salix udensis]
MGFKSPVFYRLPMSLQLIPLLFPRCPPLKYIAPSSHVLFHVATNFI